MFLFVYALLSTSFLANIVYCETSYTQQGHRTSMHRRDAYLPVSTRISNSYARVKYLNYIRGGQRPEDIAGASLHNVGGGFTMKLQLGTPPQEVEVLFDTGSDLVWVQCAEHEEAKYFDDKASSSFQTVSCTDSRCYDVNHECTLSCEYVYAYGGGSETSGRLSTETVTLPTVNGSSKAFPDMLFGCGDQNYGFQDLNGIAGFGRGQISLITQLGSSIDSKFSYCLSPSEDSSPLFYGSSAGIHDTRAQSISLLSSSLNPTFYFVRLTSVVVGGFSVPVSYREVEMSGGTIFDSGTTLTFLPASVYSRVRAAFMYRIRLPTFDESQLGLDLCYDLSSHRNYTFPSLVLEFESARMVPSVENYFLSVNDAIVCLALGSSDGLGVNVVGNMMQQGFHILFDTSASTMSFVPASCGQL